MTFIFIAGAMHRAWVWHKIIPLIQAQGAIALAPDLPGMGENCSVSTGDATLALWGDYVADLVRSAEGPVVLVGHSRGGLVIGEAAERVPERIVGLVYVCALIIPPAHTALSVMGIENVNDGPAAVTKDGKAFFISAEAAIPLFYNRCSTEDAASAAEHLCLEPLAPNATPTTITEERWGRIPRACIQTRHDRAFDISRQTINRAAAPCDPVLIIDGDHSPFLSAAPELAGAILQVAGVSP